MQTSASGWARGMRNTPSSLWRAEGYRSRYSWWHARATAQLLRWSMNASSPPRSEEDMPVLAPSGLRRYDVFELACSMPFLLKARDVTSLRGNTAGPDGRTYYHLFQCADRNNTILKDLQADLRSKTYHPGGYRALVLRGNDVDDRVLHLPNVLDKVVSRSVAAVLTALYEPHFSERSLGFRPGIAIMHAIRQLERFCRRTERWVLQKLDISKAFDSVPHDRLLAAIRVRVKDRTLMELIEKLVCGRGFRNRQGKTNVGLAMGDPLSPIFFNIYMDAVFDRVLADKHTVVEMLRWADDLILPCRNRGQAAEHRDICVDVLAPAGLRINKRKTYGDNATADLGTGEEAEYLGFGIKRDRGGRIGVRVTDGAYWSLHNQTIQDTTERRSLTIPTAGKGRALSQQVEFRLEGWMMAFAAGIPDGELHGCVGKMRFIYTRLAAELTSREDAVAHGFDVIEWPSGRTIKRLWRHGREVAGSKSYETIPDAYHRILVRQRNATAPRDQVPLHVRDQFEDGDGFVPAPFACVEPYEGRRPGYEEEEWRIALADPPSIDDPAGAGGPTEEADPRSRRVVITTDGACRQNPGPAAWAYTAHDAAGHELLHDYGLIDGDVTNMVAEYHSLIAALKWAADEGRHDIVLRNDNKTVVRQITGTARTRHPPLRQLLREVMALVAQIADTGGSVNVEHVPRCLTTAADELANVALDRAAEDVA